MVLPGVHLVVLPIVPLVVLPRVAPMMHLVLLPGMLDAKGSHLKNKMCYSCFA